MNFFQRILRFFQPSPSPQLIAQQLRQPSGMFARKVGNKMNETNAPLYDFALEEMKLADGEKVLEIGFGNGQFFEKIFKSARNLRLVGLDFSPEMVEAAKEKNQDRVASGTLDLHLGSSDAMPFGDATFDKVFCVNVIYFWETPEDHLREIRRVLKPGGRFFTIIRSKESLLLMPFTKYGFRLYEAAEWVAILKENGFPNHAIYMQEEPPFKYEGQSFQLASICISAG